MQLSRELVGEGSDDGEGFVHIGIKQDGDGNFQVYCGVWNAFGAGSLDLSLLPEGCKTEDIATKLGATGA